MVNSKELILEVIDEIMTDMFFIFPDLDDDGAQITDGDTQDDSIHVGIHFNTDFYLHFDIDRSLLREMASNFLGMEFEEINLEHLQHMACETANIIGGNYLVKADPDHTYKLSIPEILKEKEVKKLDEKEDNWEICFVADERVMKVSPYQRVD